MVYPPAPWTLRGFAMQTLQPVEIDRIRSDIPDELEIISLLPGKTVGGLYVSSYSAGSTLQYSELIVVSALVRQSNGRSPVGDHRLGVWISHIYVDNPDSVAGGREIWGLPKQLADFDWQFGRPHRVTVRQSGRLLCEFSADWQLLGVPLPFALGGFGQTERNLLWFPAESNLRLSAIGAAIEIPSASPFSHLALDKPWICFYGDALNLKVGAPLVVS